LILTVRLSCETEKARISRWSFFSRFTSPSEHVVTWSNAQELFDMLKAVVAMQVGSSPASKFTACLATPCHTSPTNQTSPQIMTSEHVQQFLDILRSLSTTQGPPPPPAKLSGESGEPKARVSRLEFKTVTAKTSRATPSLTGNQKARRPAATVSRA
jgi:hypothetical protein